MSITNTAKPTTALTNDTKVAFFETWASIQTTWATETRTWLDCGSIIENVSLSSTDPLWSSRTFPWLESSPWTLTNAGVTNVSKP